MQSWLSMNMTSVTPRLSFLYRSCSYSRQTTTTTTNNKQQQKLVVLDPSANQKSWFLNIDSLWKHVFVGLILKSLVTHHLICGPKFTTINCENKNSPYNIYILYIHMYLSKYSGIEELLQLLVAVVDTELFETVHLEIL